MTRTYTRAATITAVLLPFLLSSPSTSSFTVLTSAFTTTTRTTSHIQTKRTQLQARPSNRSFLTSTEDQLLNKLQSNDPNNAGASTGSTTGSSTSAASIQEKLKNALFQQSNSNTKIQEVTTSSSLPPPPPPTTTTTTATTTESMNIDIPSSMDKSPLEQALSKLYNEIQHSQIIDSLSTTIQKYIPTTNTNIIIENNYNNPIQSKIQQFIFPSSSSSSQQFIQEQLYNMNHNIHSLNDIPPSLSIVLSAFVTYVIVSNLLVMNENNNNNNININSPYPLGKYDPKSARIYFDQRLNEVIARGITIASQSVFFGLSLVKDKLTNQWEENSEKRGLELAQLLTRLGPTFIKIGQSLSIRTDLLSPPYVRGLTSLQDQVPPFSTDVAKEIIQDELGVNSIYDIFETFSDEPVAAASLGQVYKATLKQNGREVAIKVQRPNIMNQIALDMHFLRELAPWAKRTFNLNTDTVGTVDAWGIGFVDELDYISEAENAEYFTSSIQSTPLASVVFSPPVIDDCTTGKILTTEWVVGERLDKSSNEDVTVLCSIAMNTYLTMMLETGVLHCDPHPGNLLRTPDGKLCILDWGMVTRLEPDLQLTLIEHMAHLTSADYEEIPRDLLLLGFIPREKADLINDSGIVEVLADIYGAWTKGGGAAAINVNQVVAQLQDLTEKKGNLFQIPPYFAYIAKSFSVLEGIGLSNDPKYSIINECLPYVSKRLLTDKSERTGGALSTFIFGPEKNSKSRIIDYDRVEQLISGFGDYTTSASGASLGQEKTRTELIDDLVDQVLDLVATEEETPLQTIFIEQLAKIISASSRSIWADLRERSGVLPSGRTVLGTIVDPFGLFRTSPVVRMNSLDQKTIDTTRNLIKLLSDQASSSNNGNKGEGALNTPDLQLSNAEVQELSTKLVRKIWEKRTRIAKTSGRLATKLLQLTADKLESGERDVYFLPNNASSKSMERNVNNEGKLNAGRRGIESDRLMNARKILDEAEAEEAALSGTK